MAHTDFSTPQTADYDATNMLIAHWVRRVCESQAAGIPDDAGSALMQGLNEQLNQAQDIGVKPFVAFDHGLEAGIRLTLAILASPLCDPTVMVQDIITSAKTAFEL